MWISLYKDKKSWLLFFIISSNKFSGVTIFNLCAYGNSNIKEYITSS